jgi:ATP-binding cassette subfamily B protein
MLKNFREHLKPYIPQFIIGPFFKLLEAVLELTLPVQMAAIIDQGVAKGDADFIYQTGIRMFIIIVVGLISALICQYLASVASQGFGTRVRSAMFWRVNRFSMRDFEKFGTDTLTTRITNDVNQLQVAVAMTIRLLVRAPFVSIGCVIAALMLDLPLSVIVIAAVVSFVVIVLVIMRAAYPLYGRVQKNLDGVASLVRENCSGVRVIRAFAQGEAEKTRFQKAVEKHADSVIRVMRVSSLLNPLTMLMMNLSVVAILWFGAGQVDAGNMLSGTVIAFINYMAQILNALVAVAHLVLIFTRTGASYARVNEVFLVPETADAPDAAELSTETPRTTEPAVLFEHVSFSYSDSGGEDLEKAAVSDISFSIPRGSVFGIIGGTGSGKSTILSLITRFYDAQSGRIRILGHDVDRVSRNSIRERIGTVFQEPIIFTGTVADNLRWGRSDANEEELWAACRAAQAEEFIRKLPEKLYTPIARGAKNLSGGQKQRLSIARAFVRRPDILLLDDASSALDYTTEAKLRRSLEELRKETGMTVIQVSQRIASLRAADQILVLDDGNATGLGTHEELLRSCELYRSIALSQLSEEEVTV